MKTSDRFNHRISELVDAYQGAVPLARLILEATRFFSTDLPTLSLAREEGQICLEITFADGTRVTLAVEEEFA